MPAYKVDFEVCSMGQQVSGNTIKRGVTKPEGTPLSVVLIQPTSAQMQGVYGYLGLINAGVDTSTVESAITALTP
jgi:hypothetical protein